MKTCQKEGCYNPVFSHGFCKWHQSSRTDDKKPKNTSFQPKREPVRDLGFGFDNQTELFFHLWDNAKNEQADVICPYTGRKLNRYRNTKAFWSCFAHVLPKGRYVYFKLNPENIRVVLPEFHHIVDQGSSDDRKRHPEWDFEKWDREVEEMKVKYQEFKARNMLA